MFATIYEWKPYVAKDEVAEIMALYAELGDIPSVVAHDVRRDGTGGIVISAEMPEYWLSLAWGRFLRWDASRSARVSAHEVDSAALLASPLVHRRTPEATRPCP